MGLLSGAQGLQGAGTCGEDWPIWIFAMNQALCSPGGGKIMNDALV